jgi:hypothetical protein
MLLLITTRVVAFARRVLVAFLDFLLRTLLSRTSWLAAF